MKKRKIKRGKRKSKNVRTLFSENKTFILGGNSAGLQNKKESFQRNISLFKPAVYFIQESKLSKKGKIVIDDYAIFELIRYNTGGGGLLTAVHKSLNPVNVSEEVNDEEILVVEATFGNRKIRLINGYGPQESENEEKRMNFYSRLDYEIKRAKLSGSLICIEMDSNAKLGPRLIPNDPHPQFGNGKLLQNIIYHNNLKVVNGSNFCKGIITRTRTTISGVEQSILDHFIVCQHMYNSIVSLQVDEERKYCLTKYANKKGNIVSLKESDHNTMILELNKKWNTVAKETEQRQEILNYRNKEEFELFTKLTSDSEDLRTCFDDKNEDLETASKKWLRHLKIILKASFSKLRIKRQNLSPKLQLLFHQKETLKAKIGILEKENKFKEMNDHQSNLDKINEEIAAICAEKNKNLVDEYLGKTNDTIEGFNQAKTWGLTKKLCPKNTIEPPHAKKDKNGDMVTDKEALKKLYVETYTERLTPNQVNEEYSELKSMKEYLFDMNYKIAQVNRSKD